MTDIKSNTERILKELPPGVDLVAAAKTRTAEEIKAAIAGGVKVIGENYVQEAASVFREIGRTVEWHFIGHLQKNKVKQAVEIFDMIETVDSAELAREIDKRALAAGKVMSVLVEINSGREAQKSGILPENAAGLIKGVSGLKGIKVMGLMTMGPLAGDPEDSRPYFVETRKVFQGLSNANMPGVEMKYLSMGMTGSYKIAIEEGANLVRVGTGIFGERKSEK